MEQTPDAQAQRRASLSSQWEAVVATIGDVVEVSVAEHLAAIGTDLDRLVRAQRETTERVDAVNERLDEERAVQVDTAALARRIDALADELRGRVALGLESIAQAVEERLADTLASIEARAEAAGAAPPAAAVAAHPEPVVAEEEPVAVAAEPVVAEEEPVAVAPEPVAADPEPVVVAPTWRTAAPEPVGADAGAVEAAPAAERAAEPAAERAPAPVAEPATVEARSRDTVRHVWRRAEEGQPLAPSRGAGSPVRDAVGVGDAAEVAQVDDGLTSAVVAGDGPSAAGADAEPEDGLVHAEEVAVDAEVGDAAEAEGGERDEVTAAPGASEDTPSMWAEALRSRDLGRPVGGAVLPASTDD